MGGGGAVVGREGGKGDGVAARVVDVPARGLWLMLEFKSGS